MCEGVKSMYKFCHTFPKSIKLIQKHFIIFYLNTKEMLAIKKFSDGKTHKIKKTNIDKKSLWDKFDMTINPILEEDGALNDNKQGQIECIFLNR